MSDIESKKNKLLDGFISINLLSELSNEFAGNGDSLDELIAFLTELSSIYQDRYEILFELAHAHAVKGNVFISAVFLAESLTLSPESFEGNDTLFYLFEQINDEDERFDLMLRVALTENISNQLRYKIFYEILNFQFLGIFKKEVDFKLLNLYSVIIESMPDKDFRFDFSEEGCDKNVILMPSQFLGPLHGPTQTTLVIANELVLMGYNPIIVASNPIQFDKKYNQPSSRFHPNIFLEYNKKGRFQINEAEVRLENNSNSFSTIVNRGSEYPFFHLSGSFDEKISLLSKLLINILSTNTRIIAIGSPHLHAEIIAKHASVYLLPCNFSFPISKYTQSIICRELTDLDLNLSKSYKHKLVESRFPYGVRFKIGRDTKSDLKKYGLSNISFCLVGGRLITEIDESMLERLSVIQSNYPEAIFNFIGIDSNDDFKAKLSKFVNLDNCNFIGFTNNIKSEVLKSHFYLNPKRNGGGTSVLESLALEIPPICFKYGDGYHTAGEVFSFDNNEDVIAFIKKFNDEISFRSEVKKECERLYSLNTNVKKVIEDLTRGSIT